MLLVVWEIKYLSITAVISKSAITPSLSGLTATIEPGVRPIISFAFSPTARMESFLVSTATTEASLFTIPLPFMKTKVFAVPKSIPISFENIFICPPGYTFNKYSISFIWFTLFFIIPHKTKL